MVQVMGRHERSAFLCIHIEEVLGVLVLLHSYGQRPGTWRNSSCGMLNVSATVVTNSRSSSLASRSSMDELDQ